MVLGVKMQLNEIFCLKCQSISQSQYSRWKLEQFPQARKLIEKVNSIRLKALAECHVLQAQGRPVGSQAKKAAFGSHKDKAEI